MIVVGISFSNVGQSAEADLSTRIGIEVKTQNPLYFGSKPGQGMMISYLGMHPIVILIIRRISLSLESFTDNYVVLSIVK